MTTNPPVAVYPSGTGHASGSDTSADRETAEVRKGITSDVQRRVLGFLDRFPSGATWRELSDWTGEHHGRVSSALTNLERAGHIFRLRQTRDHCHVYVHGQHRPGYEADAVLPPSPSKPKRDALTPEAAAVVAAAEDVVASSDSADLASWADLRTLRDAVLAMQAAR